MNFDWSVWSNFPYNVISAEKSPKPHCRENTEVSESSKQLVVETRFLLPVEISITKKRIVTQETKW